MTQIDQARPFASESLAELRELRTHYLRELTEANAAGNFVRAGCASDDLATIVAEFAARGVAVSDPTIVDILRPDGTRIYASMVDDPSEPFFHWGDGYGFVERDVVARNGYSVVPAAGPEGEEVPPCE